MNFKRSSRMIITIAIILVVTFCTGFLINRANRRNLLQLTESPQTYYLENVTEREKGEKMWFVSLYSNGIAVLSTPAISSYILPKCSYSALGDELLIHAIIKNESDEKFFGLKNDDVIAKFLILDDRTLVFKSCTVPVFANINARYIYKPS